MSAAPTFPYLFVLQQSETGLPTGRRGVVARVNVATLEIVDTSLPCATGVSNFVATRDGRTLALISKEGDAPVKHQSRSGRIVNLGYQPSQLLLFNFENGEVIGLPRQPAGSNFPEELSGVSTVDGAILYLVANGGGQIVGSGQYQDIRQLARPYIRRVDLKTMANVVVWPRKESSREGVLADRLTAVGAAISEVGDQFTAEIPYDRLANETAPRDDGGRPISGRTWWQISLASGEFSVSPMTDRLSSASMIKGTGAGVVALRVFDTDDPLMATYKIVVDEAGIEHTLYEAEGRGPVNFELINPGNDIYLAMLFADHQLEIIKLGHKRGAYSVNLGDHFGNSQPAATCSGMR